MFSGPDRLSYSQPITDIEEYAREWMLAGSFNGDDSTEYFGYEDGGTL